MNEIMETVTAIPAITILCMLAAQGYKVFMPTDNKHIPLLCGVVGLLLGVVAFVWMPGYIPAENVLVAAAIGAVSGWAATGINQIYKQETGAK